MSGSNGEQPDSIERLVDDWARTIAPTPEQSERFMQRADALGGDYSEIRRLVSARSEELAASGDMTQFSIGGQTVVLSSLRADKFVAAVAALSEGRRVFSQGRGDDRKIVSVLTLDDIRGVDQGSADAQTRHEARAVAEAARHEARAAAIDLGEDPDAAEAAAAAVPPEVRLFGGDRLYTVSAVMLAMEINRCARVVKLKQTTRDGMTQIEEIPADFPKRDAEDLMQAKIIEKLPTLRGVAHVPLFDMDTGDIIMTPGYCASKQVWLSSTCPRVDVPDIVTRDMAVDSYNLLEFLVHTYEFAGERNRVAAVALLMTAVLRGSMRVAPLTISTAGQPRTGKDHLLRTAALLSTGQEATMYGLGANKEERDKRLSQMFHSSSPFIVISNVNSDLNSDDLCIFISEGSFVVRMYGNTGNPKHAEYASFWAASGNNLRPTGDLVTRCLVVRQESTSPNPGQRTFDFNPHAWLRVPENRKLALEAVYKLARWWVRDGRFETAETAMGEEVKKSEGANGFDEWQAMVRQPLLGLGKHDVFAATIEAESEQRVESQSGMFADALHSVLAKDWQLNRERARARGITRLPNDGFEFIAGAAHEAVERVKSNHSAWMRQEPNPHAPDDAVAAYEDERVGWTEVKDHIETIEASAKTSKAFGHAMKRHAGIFGASWRITRAMHPDGRPKTGGPSSQKAVWWIMPTGNTQAED